MCDASARRFGGSRKVTATVHSAGPSLLFQWPGATPHACPHQVVRRVRAAEEPDLCMMQRSDTTPNPIPWPWRSLLNCQRATVVAPPFSGLQDSQHVIRSNSVLRLLRHQAGTIRRPGLIGAPAPPLSRRRTVEKVCPRRKSRRRRRRTHLGIRSQRGRAGPGSNRLRPVRWQLGETSLKLRLGRASTAFSPDRAFELHERQV
jgi:hypothetical protein